MTQFEFAVVPAALMEQVYSNALKELDGIWDQYLAWCIETDAKERAILLADREEALRKWDRGAALEKEYTTALRKWKTRWPILRGPRPTRSAELLALIQKGDYCQLGYGHPSSQYRYVELDYDFDNRRASAESVREELTAGVALAKSGPSEFYLTQEQLERLHGWKTLDAVRAIEQVMRSAEVDIPV